MESKKVEASDVRSSTDGKREETSNDEIESLRREVASMLQIKTKQREEREALDKEAQLKKELHSKVTDELLQNAKTSNVTEIKKVMFEIDAMEDQLKMALDPKVKEAVQLELDTYRLLLDELVENAIKDRKIGQVDDVIKKSTPSRIEVNREIVKDLSASPIKTEPSSFKADNPVFKIPCLCHEASGIDNSYLIDATKIQEALLIKLSLGEINEKQALIEYNIECFAEKMKVLIRNYLKDNSNCNN
jgi:hypothetical protein